jgi:broad specificity phosphatase PhoE
MRLILVRHAHRDTSSREADNGLSEKGREQAKELVSVFKKRIGKDSLKNSFKDALTGAKIVLLSSPKKRCIETLTPFSKKIEVNVTIDPSLDEQKPEETLGNFEKRITSFLKFVQDLDQENKKKSKSSDLHIFICSHGDWLPIALQKLVGVVIDMKKGGVAEVEDGRLLGLVQPSDYLPSR